MAEGIADNEQHPVSSDSYLKAENALKDQCETLWTELRQLQAKLANVRGQHQDSATSLVSPAVDVYLARQKRLTAQISVMKDTQPSVLPESDVIQFERVKDELEKSVSSLGDMMTLVRSEQKELDDEIQKEEQFKNELEQVQSVLREKLDDALEQQRATDNSIVIKKMKNRETGLRKHSQRLMKHMAEFVQKHFPGPTESQLAKWKKHHEPLCDDSSSNDDTVLPLINILQELLNRCIDSPHNAYITIDSTFWPPYVELLVRTGIALRNPSNAQQIRLTPFHL